MKYIDAERLRAEIERLKGQLIRGACAAQIEMETNCKDEAYNEVLAFLDSLQQEQPPLPANLDEAAEKKYPVYWKDYPKDGIARSELSYDTNKQCREAFIAGAEWAMEQGVKATGTISPRGIIYDNNVGYHLFLEKYHNGDKVEVQIRKIEENGK